MYSPEPATRAWKGRDDVPRPPVTFSLNSVPLFLAYGPEGWYRQPFALCTMHRLEDYSSQSWSFLTLACFHRQIIVLHDMMGQAGIQSPVDMGLILAFPAVWESHLPSLSVCFSCSLPVELVRIKSINVHVTHSVGTMQGISKFQLVFQLYLDQVFNWFSPTLSLYIDGKSKVWNEKLFAQSHTMWC